MRVSNLPPGVTDAMIEEQQADYAFDGTGYIVTEQCNTCHREVPHTTEGMCDDCGRLLVAFSCTCGWSTEAVRARTHVKCEGCGGVAVKCRL